MQKVDWKKKICDSAQNLINVVIVQHKSGSYGATAWVLFSLAMKLQFALDSCRKR
jgi:hypothetical protein